MAITFQRNTYIQSGCVYIFFLFYPFVTLISITHKYNPIVSSLHSTNQAILSYPTSMAVSLKLCAALAILGIAHVLFANINVDAVSSTSAAMKPNYDNSSFFPSPTPTPTPTSAEQPAAEATPVPTSGEFVGRISSAASNAAALPLCAFFHVFKFVYAII